MNSGIRWTINSKNGMRKKVNNFGRFYVLAKKNPAIDKESMVLQFTDGRTTHLREMYKDEYDEMCDAIEYGNDRAKKTAQSEKLRRLRASVLLRIGRLGINTVDNWDGIDSFCLSPKISGKKFRNLSEEELGSLIRKLENIIRKGGLKALEPAQKDAEPICIYMPYNRVKYLS